MDPSDFTGVFSRIAAGVFSEMIVEDVLTSRMKLARLLRIIEDEVDVNPIIRNLVANGIFPLCHPPVCVGRRGRSVSSVYSFLQENVLFFGTCC